MDYTKCGGDTMQPELSPWQHVKLKQYPFDNISKEPERKNDLRFNIHFNVVTSPSCVYSDHHDNAIPNMT